MPITAACRFVMSVLRFNQAKLYRYLGRLDAVKQPCCGWQQGLNSRNMAALAFMVMLFRLLITSSHLNNAALAICFKITHYFRI